MAITKLDFSRIVGRSFDTKPFLPLLKDVGVEYFESDTRRIWTWTGPSEDQGWKIFYSPGTPIQTSFLDLTDTPPTYAGQKGKAVIVNNTEDGLTYSTREVVEPTGFEAVGDGYRLVGDNAALKGEPGNHSVDASLSNAFHEHKGGVGSFSLTQGYNVNNPAFCGLAIAFGSTLTPISAYGAIQGTGLAVDGYASRAYGVDNTILGHYGIAEITDNDITGNFNSARGSGNSIIAEYAGAYSDFSILSGNSSRTLGTNLFARAKGEVAVGHFNTDYTAESGAIVEPTDRAFSVGIGTGIGFEKDGLYILNDGSVVAPELGTSIIDSGHVRGLVTKEWIIANPPTLQDVIAARDITNLGFTIHQLDVNAGLDVTHRDTDVKSSITSFSMGVSTEGNNDGIFINLEYINFRGFLADLKLAYEQPSVPSTVTIPGKTGILALTSDIPTDFIGEAPTDGQQYARQSSGWAVVIGGGSGIPEAPLDGQNYMRNGLAGNWVPEAAGAVTSVHGRTGVVVAVAADYDAFYPEEAAVDNKTYGRKDAGWVELVGQDTSGLVPYLGATQDVDLGLFNSVAFDHVNTSDRRAKENIEDYVPVAVPIKWRQYTFKKNGESQIGVIADEVEKINPDFVVKGATPDDLDAVKYTRLLIAKVAELESRLSIMERQ